MMKIFGMATRRHTVEYTAHESRAGLVVAERLLKVGCRDNPARKTEAGIMVVLTNKRIADGIISGEPFVGTKWT